MPLGLVPGVRTQGQGWQFQEVHHCVTHVMIAIQEKNVRIYTDLTPKLLMFSAKRVFLSVTPPNGFRAYSFDKSVSLVQSDMSETFLSVIENMF